MVVVLHDSHFISGMRNLGNWWLVCIDGTLLASRLILPLVPLDVNSRTQNSLQARLSEEGTGDSTVQAPVSSSSREGIGHLSNLRPSSACKISLKVVAGHRSHSIPIMSLGGNK